MNVNLEQSLAAVVRFIQDNSEEGTQLYFDEIPENFYVPSVYFQIPYSAGRKATLSSYCTTMTMNRRQFLKNMGIGAAGAALPGVSMLPRMKR